MSQLTLTPEEDQIIADALRSKASQYAAMYSVDDPALMMLIDKVTGQLPQPVVAEAPIVESAPVAEAVVEPEVVVETSIESSTEVQE